MTVHRQRRPGGARRDGVSGYVTDPTPEALAVAMREVMSDRSRAIALGEAGAARVATMTWPRAIETLLR